ncbi:MAG TPA: CUAEP/CCAEP-tail radical SAM protein [Chloroflexota bacterium]|nr:CUAEP/CCAEP-tail radical SAM protein [Chloroflexota bacterium]
MTRQRHPEHSEGSAGPGEVLLVSCYELGHQPLSLASPLASLQAAGFHPRAIDTAVEALPDEAATAARLVAISVPMHTAMRLAEDVARQVRDANPGAHICLYGLYAWLNAEYAFQAGFADSVIGGEPEEALVELARWLRAGPPAVAADAAQVAATDHGGRRPSGRPRGVRFLDAPAEPVVRRQILLAPAREALPGLEHYAHLERGGEALPAGYVEATRGCKHTCLHCPITPVYRGRFLAVPRELVLADIAAQVEAGARHITFGDPDFLNGPTHSLRIVREMRQRRPELTFDATIKIEHILAHADLFPELRTLGCVFILSAVESLSDTVLGHLNKGHTGADVARALDILEAAGIPMRASLVAFTPWTTLTDYLDVLHFVEHRGLVEQVDPVQYSIRLLVPPGSALLNEPGTAEWLGALEPADYSYEWRHRDERMEALYEQVSAIVAAAEGADTWRVFAEIKTAAHTAAGLEPEPVRLTAAATGAKPPRLTESWFC